jgi:transcriptional regulator with XRE-family HTH domain
MDDARVGRLVRRLRRNRGWRMVDLAGRAGLGVSTIERLEAGRLEPMEVASIRSAFRAFGLSIDINVAGLGPTGDRLLDERHAPLLGACATWLASLAWQTQPEVSYSEYGERGSVDLLAWHAPTSTLLVVEIKTELVSVEATLRKLDEKVRLGPKIGRGLGWQPAVVARLLVLPDEPTQHRRVAAHSAVFDRAYPIRTRQVRAWCRAPLGPISGLMFMTHPERAHGGRSREFRARIRVVGQSGQ